MEPVQFPRRLMASGLAPALLPSFKSALSRFHPLKQRILTSFFIHFHTSAWDKPADLVTSQVGLTSAT